MRSFKRLKKAVAASEDNEADQSDPDPEGEDAEVKDREWEIAKL